MRFCEKDAEMPVSRITIMIFISMRVDTHRGFLLF